MIEQLQSLQTLEIIVEGPIAHVVLNRPEVKNAMNFRMVEELTLVFRTLHSNRDIRCILLRGAGGTFCAGGDIKEMREQPVPSIENAHNLDAMLRACNQAAQVVIAQVEGAALGGGFGLLCVSDIAIASTSAQMGLPEVRLGLAPAYISPFVIQRVGLTRARELMLTGRRFDGQTAKSYGLVHEACAPEELGACTERVLDEIRACAPGAIAAIKELIFTVMETPLDNTVAYRGELLNRLRQSAEAQEGMLAFMQKRPASWVSGGDA